MFPLPIFLYPSLIHVYETGGLDWVSHVKVTLSPSFIIGEGLAVIDGLSKSEIQEINRH